MFEGDSADMCAGKFPLVSMGGRAEGLVCADWGARTPIGASGIGEVPRLKAFTSCHWEKLHFFNIKSHSIWNYCTIKHSADNIDCIQMWYKRGLSAAGRDITVGVAVGHGNYGYVNINPFKHRIWNHFCWSYDSSSAEKKDLSKWKILWKCSL